MEKKFEDLNTYDTASARYRRARVFSSEIINVMSDFLPRDEDLLRKIDYKLTKLAYESNLQIIGVRPEWDEMTAAQMSAAMLQMHPAMTVNLSIDTTS